jgi:hypothetical protein
MVTSEVVELDSSAASHQDGDRDSRSLVACVGTCHNIGDKEGPLRVSEVVPLC